MPRQPKEEPVFDMSRMTLQRLEEVVGRKPYEVYVENKNVVAVFSGPDVRVLFPQW